MSRQNAGADASEKCALLQTELRRLLPEPGDYSTPVAGLVLYRREEPNQATEDGWAEPHATVVFQGVERVRIKGRDYICRSCQCRVNGQELMGRGHIAEASSERPFLAASLALDGMLIGKLAEKANRLALGGHMVLRKISVEETDLGILDAFLRLIKLLKKPSAIPVLASDIIYEIHYLLLIGPHGVL